MQLRFVGGLLESEPNERKKTMLRPSAFDCEINMSCRTFNKFWIDLSLPFIRDTHFPLFIKDAGLFFVFHLLSLIISIFVTTSWIFKLTRAHVLLYQLLIKPHTQPHMQTPVIEALELLLCTQAHTFWSCENSLHTSRTPLWLCWGQGGWRVKLLPVLNGLNTAGLLKNWIFLHLASY